MQSHQLPNEAFAHEGVDEVGYDKANPARELVKIDPKYFRPTEVELLIGDPTKAKQKLGWTPGSGLGARSDGELLPVAPAVQAHNHAGLGAVSETRTRASSGARAAEPALAPVAPSARPIYASELVWRQHIEEPVRQCDSSAVE